jgi:glutathione synthase/RimK-type ligase-like ATP-grasp enzyme
MSKMVRIWSYNKESEGAKVLSEALGIKRLKHEGSTWKPAGKTVINWGSSNLPESLLSAGRIINKPLAIKLNCDKLAFFKRMPEFLIPEWTDNKQTASQWLTEGHTVVSRAILNGHSGEGITLTSGLPQPAIGNSLEGASETIPNAPLYTKYFKKKDEYRVHIVDGVVIDVQQKKRKTDVSDDSVNWKIRNLAGGFIYAREGVAPPEQVTDVALQVHSCTGLDFGAYDIIFNATASKAICLEVNCAPGLSGSTIELYRAALQKMLDSDTE